MLQLYLLESGLSFLRLGDQIPIPSSGGKIKDHYSYIILGKPYPAMVPGLASMFLIHTFMMMRNVLPDVLNIKS